MNSKHAKLNSCHGKMHTLLAAAWQALLSLHCVACTLRLLATTALYLSLLLCAVDTSGTQSHFPHGGNADGSSWAPHEEAAQEYRASGASGLADSAEAAMSRRFPDAAWRSIAAAPGDISLAPQSATEVGDPQMYQYVVTTCLHVLQHVNMLHEPHLCLNHSRSWKWQSQEFVGCRTASWTVPVVV